MEHMAELILLNKPYRVLTQFTDPQGRATLADYIQRPGFYPAGRLDYDSEGLVALCDDGALQQRIADPRRKLWKRYWLQLEGRITDAALDQLRRGVTLKDGPTRPAKVARITSPTLWPRTPPVPAHRDAGSSWIEIAICEGRNRQLRRMTAAVGFPVLRLVRVAIGDWSLDALRPGESRSLTVHLPRSNTRGQQRGPRRRPRGSG